MKNGVQYKTYAGSSTHETRHVEGVVGLVPYKGAVEKVFEKITDGLKSGLSYQGAQKLLDLRKDPQFVLVTNAGLIESRPHDVIVG